MGKALESRRQWLRRLGKKSWVVYSKPPFDGPQRTLDYLGRYVHRVAISNHRVIAHDGENVKFTYRDRADGDRRKTTSMPAEEFIRRFLHHVLPDGFVKIRHYGLSASANATTRHVVAMQSIGPLPNLESEFEDETAVEDAIVDVGIFVVLLARRGEIACPKCLSGRLRICDPGPDPP